MVPLSFRNLTLVTLFFLLSTKAERDFNFNDDVQISFSEPQEEPKKILLYKNPYTIEYSQCPYTEGKIMLSLVLKSKDWKDLIEKKRTKVLNKLSKFFAIPKEFIDFDSVTKREILDLSKNSIRKGPNKSNTNKKLGRVDFTIGCGETYFAAGEPISNQIGLQMKDGSLNDIAGVDFGWWVIWRKKLSNRVQRYRRQIEGSGEEEYEYDYEDEDSDDEIDEPVTEIPQVTTHAHRHHHGLAKPEITETSKIKKISLSKGPGIVENANKIKRKKNDFTPLVRNENIDEDIVRGVTKLESDITKTIENTKRIKDLPPFVDSEINSSPLQEDFRNIFKNNDDFVIDDFDTTTPITIGVTTRRLPNSSRNNNNNNNNHNDNNNISSISRSSATAKVNKSTTTLLVEKPASVTPSILLEQTTLLTSTTPTTFLPKQAEDSSTLVPLITDEVVINKVNTIIEMNQLPIVTTTTTESSIVVTTPIMHVLTPNILATTSTIIPLTSSTPSITTITPPGVTEQSEITTLMPITTTVATILTIPTTTSSIVLSIKNDTPVPRLIEEEDSTSILPMSFDDDEEAEVITTTESESSTVPTTTTEIPVTTTTEITSTSTTTPSTTSTTTSTTPTTTTTTTTSTTPKPTTTPTIPTTEFIEPEPVNTPPIIKNRLKKHPVTAGKPFSLTVPLETFYDNEDGTNLRLDLLDKNGNELKSTSWIQFNAESREIYGLPLEDAVSRWQYKLAATDSSNETVLETVDISVQQHKGHRSVNHEISIGVKLIEKYVRNIDWQLRLIEGIVSTLGDDSMFAIVVREIRQNQLDPQTAMFVYTNETLPKSECPDEQLNDLVKRLNEKLLESVQLELSIKSVSGQTVGPCLKQNVPKPKPTSHMAKNYPPVPRNQVDRVNATVGHLLVYKVPADTFYDPNDSTDLKLSLLTIDRKELGTRHWLQFDSKNQEFYGIPKSGDAGTGEYLLQAEDSGGLTATDALVVVVGHAPKREFSVYFKAYLAIRHEQFNSDMQRKFVERIAQLFGDHTTQFIQVRSITTHHDSDGTIVNFYNTTLYKSHNRCPEEEIEAARNVYFHQDTLLRDRVRKTIGGEFNLTNIQVISLGSCHPIIPDVIHRDIIPIKTDEPNTTSTFTDDYLFTFILPAVIIVVMIVLASIIACVLHRRRLTGKMELGDEDERKSFRSKGIPVIFQDELDEKPEIGNKSPIILKDEKPPLLPPYHHNNHNMDGKYGDHDVDEYVPPPAVIVGGREMRGKSPVTPSYRKPPPYVSP